MNNITQFDPFSKLTSFDPLPARLDPFLDMGDVFDQFMMRPILRGGMGIELQIKMDVKEADGKYLIKAEIPGVNKDDIHVSVDCNRISISAEVKHEKKEAEVGRVIRSERSCGMASRSFNLACEVDQSAVKASYNNGVLELTLPKKPGATRREIPIS